MAKIFGHFEKVASTESGRYKRKPCSGALDSNTNLLPANLIRLPQVLLARLASLSGNIGILDIILGMPRGLIGSFYDAE